MRGGSKGPRWPWLAGWLVVASMAACRPGAVNEAAQPVQPVTRAIPPTAPAVVVATPVVATPAPAEAVHDPAALLAMGQPEAALTELAALPAATAGEPGWFVQEALRGRAERLRGQPALASAALAPLVAARKLPAGAPRELILDEYARSLMAEAATLPRGEADALRRKAAEQWRKAIKMEPVRNLAVMRVALAEALAEIEGEGGSRRAAASQAVKALTDVLRAYPQHPRTGALELARAQALARAGKSREALAGLRRVAIVFTGRPEAEAAEAARSRRSRPFPRRCPPSRPRRRWRP